MPPLRDRREDIPLLVVHFLAQLPTAKTSSFNDLTPDLQRKLMSHDWPGNLRELRVVMERLALAAVVVINLDRRSGWVACPALLAAGTLLGALNGLIVWKTGVDAFIVTLGSLTAIRGLVLILTNGRSLIVSTPEAKAQMVAFEGGKVPIQTAVVIAGILLIVVFGWRLLRGHG